MMNEEQDIHKQPSSPDMLNSDSLDMDKDDDSLASELTDEEKESYVMLAKMARMRHKTPCPDVDETWKQFSRQLQARCLRLRSKAQATLSSIFPEISA